MSRSSFHGIRPAPSQYGSGRSCSSSTTGSKLSSKYGNIKAAINTGLNMRKINEKYPEAKVNARFKKEENFRRMKPTTMMRLLHENQTQCLLLDIREKDEYETCHLKDAISYPAALLRRSVNMFTIDIINFMNKEPHKIIIFYDEESEHAASVSRARSLPQVVGRLSLTSFSSVQATVHRKPVRRAGRREHLPALGRPERDGVEVPRHDRGRVRESRRTPGDASDLESLHLELIGKNVAGLVAENVAFFTNVVASFVSHEDVTVSALACCESRAVQLGLNFERIYTHTLLLLITGLLQQLELRVRCVGR